MPASRDKRAQRVARRPIFLVAEGEEGRLVARTAADAPEIDGKVIIPGEWELDPGDFIEVDITRSGPHDLLGVPVQEGS